MMVVSMQNSRYSEENFKPRLIYEIIREILLKSPSLRFGTSLRSSVKDDDDSSDYSRF